MKRIHVILINAIALSAASLLIRVIDMGFNVYLSNKMGAAGMGLFHLIISVYVLAKTLATSGIRFTATRLTAEEFARGNGYGAKKSILYCTLYGLFFGILASFLLFFCAEAISRTWLYDERCILSLKILAMILPFVSISAVMDGYFTAVRRAPYAAAVQLAESLTEIFVIVFLFTRFPVQDIKYACAIIASGYLAGEAVSALLFFILYRFDSSKRPKRKGSTCRLLFKMLSIALPVAFSAYLSSGMRTVQNLIIPIALKKSGISAEAALSSYGLILGMVMPAIMFPAIFLDITADIIVPELAESRAQGKRKRENYIVTRVFEVGMMAAICIMCIFIRFADEISFGLYKSFDAAHFMKILSPAIPILYLDFIVDSALKGIGEQISSMRYNILESTLSICFLMILLPKIGIYGYIVTFYITRVLNFYLSVNRLIKKTNLYIDFYKMAKSLLCMFFALFITGFFTVSLSVWTECFLTAAIYFVMLRLTGCITRDDALWFKSIFRA